MGSDLGSRLPPLRQRDPLEQGATLLAPLTHIGGGDKGWQMMGWVNLQSGFIHDHEDVVVERTNVLTSGSTTQSSDFWAVPDEGWPRPNSFVGTLGRYADFKGRILSIQGENIDFGYYNGPTMHRRYMVNGERIVLPAFKLFLEE